MDPEAYRSLTAQLRDRRVLAHHWLFAGDRRDLPDHLDSFALTLAETPIILINDHGTIRGFVNSCRHRGSELTPPGKSHGALVCPYHGWSYRPDGILSGIPRSETFPAHVGCQRGSAGLRPVGVLTVGDLLLVRVAGDDQASSAEARAWIEPHSRVAGTPLSDVTYAVAANWKVVLENALEGYHIPLVHRETFAPASLAGGHDQYAYLGPHSEGAGGTTAETLARWQRLLRLIPDRPFPDPVYRHRLVYPNTCLWSFFGCLLGITTATPTGPETCSVRVRMYATSLPTGTPPAVHAMLTGMAHMMVPFIAQVQSEDNRTCEGQQRGLAGMNTSALLGHDEERVAAYHAHYAAGEPSTAAKVNGRP